MKNVALAAVAALALGVLASVRAESQQASPYQLAFVDVDRVVRDYAKRATIEAEMKSKAEAADKLLSGQREQLEQKGEQLKKLSDDSPDRERLERELGMEIARLKSEGEWQNRKFERDRNARYVQLYGEVCYEIRLQADQRGLAAVFANDVLEPGWEKKSDFAGLMRNRTVLHADQRIDMTQSVIDALNAKLPK